VSDRLWNLLADQAASGPHGRRLLILTYHRVLERPDELLDGDLDAQAFDAQLRLFKRRFQVLRRDEALTRLDAGTLPARAVAITFDDGYADNRTVALPVLQRHGLPATFFIATAFLDGGRMWNDTIIESLRRAAGATLDLSPLGLGQYPLTDGAARKRAIESVITALKHREPLEREQTVRRLAELIGAPLPDDLMMTSAQVKELAQAGMLIGGHTMTHPVLTAVADGTAQTEIAKGRERLRELTGQPINLFAYPNGRPRNDYQQRHVQMVRELGFAAAVSTAWGFADRGSDRWQLPRVAAWDPVPWRLHLRLLRAYREPQAAYAH
jgi:peptidoglycan/xylan/chitin deacetylase (PgdA/CDA1 family)